MSAAAPLMRDASSHVKPDDRLDSSDGATSSIRSRLEAILYRIISRRPSFSRYTIVALITMVIMANLLASQHARTTIREMAPTDLPLWRTQQSVPAKAPYLPVPYDVSQPGGPLNKNRGISQFAMTDSADKLIPSFDHSVDVKGLPLMAWVIVLAPSAVEQYGEVLQHISCYCMLHNIAFYVDYALGMSTSHFFTARHYNIAKYLRRYQWVLVTDGDMMVANSSIKPWKIIDEAPADIDVIFADRGGAEVCSCTYFLRNSPGGWSFLRRWIAWGSEYNPNADNGDLNELILSGLKPGPPSNADGTGRISIAEMDVYRQAWAPKQWACVNLPAENHYAFVFLGCVSRALKHYRTMAPWEPWFDMRLFEWSEALPSFGMRIYKEFSGFSRNDPEAPSGIFRQRLPEDWLYHLHKSAQLQNASMQLCTGDEWAYEPLANQTEIDNFFGWYNPYSYYRCWTQTGRFLCNPTKEPTPDIYGTDDDWVIQYPGQDPITA